MKRKKTQKKMKKEECEFLYIDIFGHPYCTKNIKEGMNCEFFIPSEEYQEMRRQLKEQGVLDDKNSHFKVPSTYRCAKYDKYADKNGHLPPKMRPRPPKGFGSITGEF
jgi:CRISPR/Cas system Type II protein with McrA/HNH and RuvC-like nuclease domain